MHTKSLAKKLLGTGYKIARQRKAFRPNPSSAKKISLTIRLEKGFVRITSQCMQTRAIIFTILLAWSFILMHAHPVAMQNIRIAGRQLPGEDGLAKLCLGWWPRLSISSVTIEWLVPDLLFRNHDDAQWQSLHFLKKLRLVVSYGVRTTETFTTMCWC